MTSSQHVLYILGDTHATMGENRASPNREVEQIAEKRPQFRLTAATRRHEVGVASKCASAKVR